jgi:hypothetical protein
MRPIARMFSLSLSLAWIPLGSVGAQSSCTPSYTNGLRPFGPGIEVRFEPSAAAALPGECAVLVFSDASDELEAFRFPLGPEGLGAGELVSLPGAPGVVGLEAAAWTADSTGILVLTSGALDGAPSIDQSREDRALIVGRDDAGEWHVADDLTAPWRRFLDRLRRRTGGWLNVEAVHALGERYVVGIRQFGLNRDHFDYGSLLVVWDPAEPTVTTVLADPRSVTVVEADDTGGHGGSYTRTYGVSSLECAPEDAPGRLRCYMLASAESGPSPGEVKTRLLVFELDELDDVRSLPGREVACFWGKGEGLTLLPDGMALVVFDSDRSRKGGSGASDLLPLEDNQDWYWVGQVEAGVGPPWEEGGPLECVGP